MGYLGLEELLMNPLDMLPIPMTGKPNTELTEIGRRPSGEGWETITYQGADGNRYEVMSKGETKARWVLIPTNADPQE